jgi:peptidase MA superfamily protein
LNEGLAMYFEGRELQGVERALTAAGAFVPLATLEKSFSHLTEAQARVAYAESLFAVTALVERISTIGLAELLQDLDGGEPVDTAVQRFGFTMADFEAKLARRVGSTRSALP